MTKAVEQALTVDVPMRTVAGDPWNARPHPRIYTDAWRDFMENARFKTVVDLHAYSRQAFVGVKLTFPFGD